MTPEQEAQLKARFSNGETVNGWAVVMYCQAGDPGVADETVDKMWQEEGPEACAAKGYWISNFPTEIEVNPSPGWAVLYYPDFWEEAFCHKLESGTFYDAMHEAVTYLRDENWPGRPEVQ
jgi:hypothetical protein